jgi:[ribosomal protein S5]-alanine N-acetyltransferase
MGLPSLSMTSGECGMRKDEHDPRLRRVRVGSYVFLRELLHEDITEEYLSWFRDRDVTRFLESSNLTLKEVLDHLDYGRETRTYLVHAICLLENDLHVGNIKIGPIDRKHMVSDLVTVIGNKNYWGRGIATEAIKLATNIAFEDLNMRKMSASIYSDNIASVKCYLRAGWVKECSLKGQYILHDKTMDKIMVACFNPKHFGVS